MRQYRLQLLALCWFIILLWVGVVLGRPGSPDPGQIMTGLDISWWSVDGGGGRSTGGAFELSGTAGQADTADLEGGGYELRGGFWSWEVPDRLQKTYLPLVLDP